MRPRILRVRSERVARLGDRNHHWCVKTSGFTNETEKKPKRDRGLLSWLDKPQDSCCVPPEVFFSSASVANGVTGSLVVESVRLIQGNRESQFKIQKTCC